MAVPTTTDELLYRRTSRFGRIASPAWKLRLRFESIQARPFSDAPMPAARVVVLFGGLESAAALGVTRAKNVWVVEVSRDTE